MSGLASEAIAEAQTWIGTPYRHQASCKGGGADCLGLIRGIWRALYGDEPESVPAYSADWSEPQGEEALWDASSRHLIAQSGRNVERGDVVLFRMRNDSVAKHLGVISSVGPTASFIHAYSGQGVVQSPLSAPWARRVVARFQFPERTN
jgi:NlpC/P60 family putative phage cell wall peptidase